MKIVIALLSVTVLASCAMTYRAPSMVAPSIDLEHGGSKDDVFVKAMRTLSVEGYQIQSENIEAGVISTVLKNRRISTDEADCGQTMGLDYLKDNRTKTELAINIIVDESRLVVKANIHGEYEVGSMSGDLTLSCVSRGPIERRLADQILGS